MWKPQIILSNSSRADQPAHLHTFDKSLKASDVENAYQVYEHIKGFKLALIVAVAGAYLLVRKYACAYNSAQQV